MQKLEVRAGDYDGNNHGHARWLSGPSCATAPLHASRRPSGIVVTDDNVGKQAIMNYLTDYYCIYSCALSNLTRVAHHLADTRLRFIILQGRDHKRALEILSWIRARSNIATIVAAAAGCEQECVATLEHGADDYLTEPISLRELLARIRGIIRLERPKLKGNGESELRRYFFDGWLYDHGLRRLTNPQQERVVLTRSENDVLRAFLEAPGRTLTRQYLLRVIRLREDIADRSVDVRILRLRRKLHAGGAKPDIILTERGRGYIFATNVEQA